MNNKQKTRFTILLIVISSLFYLLYSNINDSYLLIMLSLILITAFATQTMIIINKK